nr:hypothetical protein [uncultured Cohaesibacter sp.]
MDTSIQKQGKLALLIISTNVIVGDWLSKNVNIPQAFNPAVLRDLERMAKMDL